MLGEDVRPLHAAHVPQDAAAHAGEYAHQQHQKHVGAVARADGHRRPVDGENPQTQRIRRQQHRLPHPVVAGGVPLFPHDEQQQRCGDGHQRLQGILQRRRRRQPQQHVPQDAAAHGGGHAHHGHAEQVHPLFHGQRRAGDGKGHRSEQLKIKLKIRHGRIPFSHMRFSYYHIRGKESTPDRPPGTRKDRLERPVLSCFVRGEK